MNKNKIVYSAGMVCSLLLVGCGGGGGDSDNSSPQADTVEISVIDGRLAFATVCLDTNNNLVCENDEQTATTNQNGVAVFKESDFDANATILAQAVAGQTEDLERGIVTESFSLIATADSRVVSPFTDAVHSIMSSDDTDLVSAQETLANTIMASNPNLEGINEIILSDYTTLDEFSASVIKRIGEIMVDLHNNSDYNSSLIEIVEGLSISFSGLDQSEITNFYPIIEGGEGTEYQFSTNYQPYPIQAEINAQTISLGEQITPVDLNNLFTDPDGNNLTFSILNPLPGIEIQDGILEGEPTTQSSTKLQIIANDGLARSKPIYFDLTVEGAPVIIPAADKKITALTEFAGSLPSTSGVFFANDFGVYHWAFSDNGRFIDIVVLDANGSTTTYSFDGTDSSFTFDSSGIYTNLPLGTVSSPLTTQVDNGFYYRGISKPIEKNGAFYFSTIIETNLDENSIFQDWKMVVSDEGIPIITSTSLEEPACNQVHTTRTTCDATWMYAANLNDGNYISNIYSSDAPFDELFDNYLNSAQQEGMAALLVDEYWYGFTNQNNSQVSFVIVSPDREAQYLDINVTDSQGIPVRDMEAVAMRYHPDRNSIYFIAVEGKGLSSAGTYVVGEYQIATKTLQWLHESIGTNYHDSATEIALADGGVYLLLDDLDKLRYYESASNTISIVNVEVPYARYPKVASGPFMLADGSFIYVDQAYNWDLRENRVVKATVE